MADFLTGGFGGLAGGILGSIGSIWQNKTQLKIARETNAMNRQMFDDQLAYNTDMWNKQNEYNDPLAQRQRLENAGLNPLFFGLDGTGNASGWQSATPVPAQGAAVNNPLDPLSQGVSSMVDQQLAASERDKNYSDIKTAEAFRFVDTQLKVAQLRKLDHEADILHKELTKWDENFKADIDNKKAQYEDYKSQKMYRYNMAFASVQDAYAKRDEIQNNFTEFLMQYELNRAEAIMRLELGDLQLTLLAQDVLDRPAQSVLQQLGINSAYLKNKMDANQLITLLPGLLLDLDLKEKENAYYELKTALDFLGSLIPKY